MSVRLTTALPGSEDRPRITSVPEPTQEDHFASAATRHFHDGDYLRKGSRLAFPPKNTGADFLKHSYWSNRGKLDVPKERFVSYPGASTDNDPSLLLGWADWNHRDQAEVLVNLLMDRSSVDGWSKDDPCFVPLLAGLQEIMPWVHQGYDAYDEEWGDNSAQEFQTALNRGRADRNLSQDDLRAWRPEKKRAGRKKTAE